MKLLLREDPIRGLPSVVQFTPGLTIAEIFAFVPVRDDRLRPYMRARIGEHVIDRAIWHRVRPKECDFAVIFEIPLHGGGGGRGGGSKTLSAIASIALLGAAFLVGGGGIGLLGIKVGSGFLSSFFAAGQLGARLGAIAIPLTGALAIQGLNHQDVTKPKSPKQIGFASANNDFDPGGPLQRVVGTCQVSPKLVIPPFTSIDRDDQTVVAVFALDGHHQWEKIKLGDVEIEDAFDVEYETRDGVVGDDPLTFVTNTPIEEAVQIALSEWKVVPDNDNPGEIKIQGTENQASPIFHRVETKRDVDGFRMEFLFPSGLSFHNENHPYGSVYLWVRFREFGGDWIDLPAMLLVANEPSRAVRAQFWIKWVNAIPDTAGNDWPRPGVGDGLKHTRGWGHVASFDYMPGSEDFLTPTGDSGFEQWEYDDQVVTLYLLTSQYPKGRYQFEVKRSWPIKYSDFDNTLHAIFSSDGIITDQFWSAYNDSGKVIPYNPTTQTDSMVLTSIQSLYEESPIDQSQDPIALLAIRAKNRAVDRVTAEASGLVPIWNGTIWMGPNKSSNPAAHYRDVLMGSRNAVPVPSSLIDQAGLQDWYEWCDTIGKYVGFVAEGKSVIETLQAIALCGFGSPRFGAINGIVIDRPRITGPVGMITQRNASGFSFSKPFPQSPHALRINFIDADDDYAPREITVYDDGYNADGSGGLIQATRFQVVNYEGILHEDEIGARAALDMRWARWRSRLLNFTMDIEHLEFAKGDLVWVETDIIGTWGGRGRIAAVNVSAGHVQSIDLDENYIFADIGTPPLGVKIRVADGTIVGGEVTASLGNSLTFVTPPLTSVGIAEGQLVIMGALSKEARQVLIWEIAPGKDGTASITCVDYAGDHMYDTRVFPAGAVHMAGVLDFSSADNSALLAALEDI